MVSLTVLYPKTPNSHFNMDYYIHTHTPLVKERLTAIGLTSVTLRAGAAGAAPDSPPSYAMICDLNFASVEALQNALATHGAELTGDIPNFTNVRPMMQISQAL
jgi:uncharacterized protein (TIGR02118 family)